MVARSGVVFLEIMEDILANCKAMICFGSFTVTSTIPVAVTSPATAGKIVTVPATAITTVLALDTHLPKPDDIVQEWSASST
jgi:hypothetical protein